MSLNLSSQMNLLSKKPNVVEIRQIECARDWSHLRVLPRKGAVVDTILIPMIRIQIFQWEKVDIVGSTNLLIGHEMAMVPVMVLSSMELNLGLLLGHLLGLPHGAS